MRGNRLKKGEEAKRRRRNGERWSERRMTYRMRENILKKGEEARRRRRNGERWSERRKGRAGHLLGTIWVQEILP